MTQALNLALFANFVNSSGQVSASGIQAGAIPASFPTGTLMLFQQTSAPTGWTKETTHNNKALRVVSGTAGSGGSTVFTSVFANQTPSFTGSIGSLAGGATTLSSSQMPSHTHEPRNDFGYTPVGFFSKYVGFPGVGVGSGCDTTYGTFAPTAATGGSGSHSHSITGTPSGTVGAVTLNVAYVDLIIASKN